jgi:acyl-CoA thioester hydrolase
LRRLPSTGTPLAIVNNPSMRDISLMYSKTLFAGWADMDFNSHMKNTAFLDKAADVRMMFFSEHGFPVDEFARLRLGPAIMKDEVEYRREVGLMQEITVTLAMAGCAGDGSRYMLQNEILRPDGTLCARVKSVGGWLDLNLRKLVAPPAFLYKAMQSLAQTKDFTILPSSVKVRDNQAGA